MILVHLLFWANSLWAAPGGGNVVGNGGLIVACASGTEVLDIFAGRGQGYHYKNLEALRSLDTPTAFKKAVRLFLKNRAWNANRLEWRFGRLNQTTRFIATDVDQTGAFSIDANLRGCAAKRVAVQYGSRFPLENEDIRLVVAANDWSRLGADQKVALLFHEYLLKDYLFQSNQNCVYGDIQRIVGFILSDEALRLSPGDWSWTVDFRCQDGNTALR